MRKPAETAAVREDRNATSGSIFMSGPGSSTHRLHARAARQILAADLESLPDLRDRLDEKALDRLELFVALLLEANQRVNLTRVTDPHAVARTHLLDSLAALPIIDEMQPATAVDLGSGGGLPAIPLAVARPGVAWLLVDSVGKKARELVLFAQALGLPHLEVASMRAEELGRDRRWRESADLVTARAVAGLPIIAELAMPLLRDGGELLSWKGPLAEDDDEVRRARTAVGEVGGGMLRISPTGVPQLGGHTFVRATKVRPTPDRYPRRTGAPQRRPLG
jgi:16S rRNA (guanine527-N7)-methyltransferase